MLHLLLSNLDTPSQQVQEAIARCLPPLASVVKPDAEDIVKKLLNKVSPTPSLPIPPFPSFLLTPFSHSSPLSPPSPLSSSFPATGVH